MKRRASLGKRSWSHYSLAFTYDRTASEDERRSYGGLCHQACKTPHRSALKLPRPQGEEARDGRGCGS